jgi:hypothetical protein
MVERFSVQPRFLSLRNALLALVAELLRFANGTPFGRVQCFDQAACGEFTARLLLESA